MKRVFYRPKALADIQALFAYSRSEWGEDQAADYLNGLEALCSALAKLPKLGRPAGDYRRFRYERHVLFYRVERSRIVIVRILHERMVPARHL